MDEFTAVLRAREFVKNASIGSIPVDLRKYLDIIKAECKVEYDFDDDQSGETTVIAGRRCIFINGLHSSERQRFTTLHEIAHVVLELPSVHGHKLDDRALISYAHRPPEEMFCDVFAAECLLPSMFFKRDVDLSSINFQSVTDLANRYQASLTSTGSRFAFLNDEPCAFVLAESGYVRYVSSSKTMREWGCWIKIGKQVPRGSVSQRLLDGEAVGAPSELETSLWLDDQRKGGDALLEEACLLTTWEQVLSLLWFEEGDTPTRTNEFDSDDEPGLTDLDGVLPWPSKKHRR
jgi:hypothetical protein